jgi:FkbH-like protein
MSAENNIRLGLLADFNVQNLAALLQKSTGSRDIKCGPLGQVVRVLLDCGAEFWSAPLDAVVVWTTPEQAVPSFRKALAFEEYAIDDILSEVDQFAALVQRVPENVKTIFVPSWTIASADRGWGALDLANGVGVANALMRMNLRMAELVVRDRRMVLLHAQRWLSQAGPAAYNPKLWYSSKTPFDTAVFREAAQDIAAALDGIRGRSKKIAIVDLDNTLWGGVVGDVGWKNLRLGGHDPVGEAFADFQKALKRLTNRGVVLAIVSKNEESVALDAINNHPEMILRAGDFAGWRINWDDKAKNIADLLAQLNLGADSAVFLDDSAFERARVAEALPQVLVPEMPQDPMQYPTVLSRLRCFDNPFVSAEDRTRTKMYVAERERAELRSEITSLDQWLASLELAVAAEALGDNNLERVAQLFNKTNQMNLSTRRMPASELLSWSQQEGHSVWAFRVWDKFGDYGLCGIVSFVTSGATAHVVDFLLSCRVMGRGVEDAMLAAVTQHVKEAGCDTLCATYVASARNQPCRRWLEQTTATEVEANKFVFSLGALVALPAHVKVIVCETHDQVLA